MDAKTQTDSPQYALWQRILSPLLGVLLIGGLIGGGYYSCASQNEIREAGHAYLQLLRDGDYDAAYAQIASETKQKVSRAEFESALNTPELSRSTDAGWNQSRTASAGHGCVDGGVVVDGESFGLTLYMRREQEFWKVQSVYFDRTDYTDEPWPCP